MRPVYLNASCEAKISLGHKAPLHALALWRRMTPLQKVSLEVFARACEENEALVPWLQSIEAPLFFTSAYGEVGAMLRLTEDIEAQALPVSPKDFQHSVLNASAAYIGIQHQWRQPAFAISGGYASADLSLHLAARRIAAGLDEGAVILHAHEIVDETDSAQAELLVLSPKPGKYRLARYEQGRAFSGFVDFDEIRSRNQIPWMLEKGSIRPSRVLRTRYGTELQTEWEL
jgi:hypothetical protein